MASLSTQNDSKNKCLITPAIAHIIFTLSNTMLVVFRAYVFRQYSFLAFIFFMYFGFFLLDYFSFLYHRLSPDQKSRSYRNMLGLAIWFLKSLMMFVLVFQIAPLFPFSYVMLLYAIVGAGSCCLFYLYMIFDNRGDYCDHKKFEEEVCDKV